MSHWFKEPKVNWHIVDGSKVYDWSPEWQHQQLRNQWHSRPDEVKKREQEESREKEGVLYESCVALYCRHTIIPREYRCAWTHALCLTDALYAENERLRVIMDYYLVWSRMHSHWHTWIVILSERTHVPYLRVHDARMRFY